jgi:putative membrane protein
LNLGFQVDGFWPALWGSILVSLVSFLLSVFVKDDRAERSVIIIRG